MAGSNVLRCKHLNLLFYKEISDTQETNHGLSSFPTLFRQVNLYMSRGLEDRFLRESCIKLHLVFHTKRVDMLVFVHDFRLYLPWLS